MLPRFRIRRHGPQGGFIVRGADADENGEITASAWQARVDTFDADGNGTIEESEWLAALPGAPDHEPPPGFFEMITQHLDRNDNGVLETSDLDAVFAEHDGDGDGVITESELPGRGSRGRGMRRGRA